MIGRLNRRFSAAFGVRESFNSLTCPDVSQVEFRPRRVFVCPLVKFNPSLAPQVISSQERRINFMGDVVLPDAISLVLMFGRQGLAVSFIRERDVIGATGDERRPVREIG